MRFLELWWWLIKYCSFRNLQNETNATKPHDDCEDSVHSELNDLCDVELSDDKGQVHEMNVLESEQQ